MVPPLEVDIEAIAAAKAEKFRSQIHRARTWQTVQRVMDAIDADLLLSPNAVNALKAYGLKRMETVGPAMVVSKQGGK